MAMSSDLLSVVERGNPWLRGAATVASAAGRRLPSSFLPRTAQDALRPLLSDHRRAHLVIGPRQAGKSTLLWSLVADAPSLLYLDCEERLVRNWCRSPALFLTDAERLLPSGGVLFLEEAQWLEEAGLFLKGLVDHGRERVVFATGSSSFHLLSRTRESLAGRATRHRVWPLSLAEVGRLPEGAATGVLPAIRREAVDRLLVWGGYPEVWTADSPREVLLDLVEAFVLRDASDRFRIERPDALRLLLELAARQVGDLVNLSEWAALARIAASTVDDYLGLLEETHVVARVRPFVGGRRAEITSTPKLYFLDNGLRNQLAGGFAPLAERVDRGKLMENLVFSELHKRWPNPGEVRFWRSKNGAEIDFIVQPAGTERLVAVEVKAGTSPRRRVSRGARSFLETYQPHRFLIVHRGDAGTGDVEGVPVEWVPVESLPEALGSIVEE